MRRGFVNTMCPKYKAWLKELKAEDRALLGCEVDRPQSALNMLYNIYRKHNE